MYIHFCEGKSPLFSHPINTFPTNDHSTQEKESDEAEELGMDNMKGVFLVLEIGTAFAFIYGCVELGVSVYRNAKKAKVHISFKYFALIMHSLPDSIHKASHNFSFYLDLTKTCSKILYLFLFDLIIPAYLFLNTHACQIFRNLGTIQRGTQGGAEIFAQIQGKR